MYPSSPASHIQNAKLSKFRRQFQTASVRVLLNKVLQALKETLGDCKKKHFSTEPHSMASKFIYSNSFLLNYFIKLTLVLTQDPVSSSTQL